eukprot:1150660-Pelagomonas_calceolata.AAC.1
MVLVCSHQSCMQATCASAEPDGTTDWSICHHHFPESVSSIQAGPDRSPNCLDGAPWPELRARHDPLSCPAHHDCKRNLSVPECSRP